MEINWVTVVIAIICLGVGFIMCLMIFGAQETKPDGKLIIDLSGESEAPLNLMLYDLSDILEGNKKMIVIECEDITDFCMAQVIEKKEQ